VEKKNSSLIRNCRIRIYPFQGLGFLLGSILCFLGSFPEGNSHSDQKEEEKKNDPESVIPDIPTRGIKKKAKQA